MRKESIVNKNYLFNIEYDILNCIKNPAILRFMKYGGIFYSDFICKFCGFFATVCSVYIAYVQYTGDEYFSY